MKPGPHSSRNGKSNSQKVCLPCIIGLACLKGAPEKSSLGQGPLMQCCEHAQTVLVHRQFCKRWILLFRVAVLPRQRKELLYAIWCFLEGRTDHSSLLTGLLALCVVSENRQQVPSISSWLFSCEL
jgi:hypothetical protein